MNLYPSNESVERRTLIYLCGCVSGALRKKEGWQSVLELIFTNKGVFVESQGFQKNREQGSPTGKERRRSRAPGSRKVLSVKFNPEAPKEKASASPLK